MRVLTSFNTIELKDNYENERATRIEREKEIMQKLSDEVYKLLEELKNEKTERVFRQGEIRDEFRDKMKVQTKFMEGFQKKTLADIETTKITLETEMRVRFERQDEIIDNLSNFIKTFQDTLKVVSQNS